MTTGGRGSVQVDTSAFDHVSIDRESIESLDWMDSISVDGWAGESYGESGNSWGDYGSSSWDGGGGDNWGDYGSSINFDGSQFDPASIDYEAIGGFDWANSIMGTARPFSK
jgi:hypothetical protein